MLQRKAATVIIHRQAILQLLIVSVSAVESYGVTQTLGTAG